MQLCCGLNATTFDVHSRQASRMKRVLRLIFHDQEQRRQSKLKDTSMVETEVESFVLIASKLASRFCLD